MEERKDSEKEKIEGALDEDALVTIEKETDTKEILYNNSEESED